MESNARRDGRDDRRFEAIARARDEYEYDLHEINNNLQLVLTVKVRYNRLVGSNLQ